MLLEVLQQGLRAHRLLLTNCLHEMRRAPRVLRETGERVCHIFWNWTLLENFRSRPVVCGADEATRSRMLILRFGLAHSHPTRPSPGCLGSDKCEDDSCASPSSLPARAKLEHAASLTLDGALAPQHHAEKIAPIRHG